MYIYKMDRSRPMTVYRYDVLGHVTYFCTPDKKWFGAAPDKKDIVVPDTFARLMGATI